MKKFLKISFFLILIIAFAGIIYYKINANNETTRTRQRGAPLVKLEKPVRETVFYKLQFNGDVMAIQQANIFSKVSGNIEHIYVDIGMSVRNGQLLALIDQTELNQKVQETSAIFFNARTNYERTKQLLEQNLLAKEDLDNAEATMKIAQANYENAKTRLSYTRITAPFSGYITKRFLDVGALVSNTNTILFTLMDITSVKIIVNVLEKDISLIPRVKKAIIVVDAFPGKEFCGTISRSSQAIELSTRTMAVEIDIPNQDIILKPGMFATVTLVIEEHPNALLVPTQAILKDNNGTYVFTVDNNVAKRIDIKIGIEQSIMTEILSGIEGTEDVITTGQQFVRNGGPVLVQK